MIHDFEFDIGDFADLQVPYNDSKVRVRICGNITLGNTKYYVIACDKKKLKDIGQVHPGFVYDVSDLKIPRDWDFSIAEPDELWPSTSPIFAIYSKETS